MNAHTIFETAWNEYKCLVCERAWSIYPTSPCFGIKTHSRWKKSISGLRPAYKKFLSKIGGPPKAIRLGGYGVKSDWAFPPLEWLYQINHPEPVKKFDRCPACGRKTLAFRRGICTQCFGQWLNAEGEDYTNVETLLAVIRQRAITWAQNMLKDSASVILDVEVLGRGRNVEIIELGIISPSTSLLFLQLFQPSQPISPREARTNKIPISALLQAPTFTDYYPQILELLSEKKIISYGAGLDKRFLQQTCQRYGLPPIKAKWHCAMKEFARFYGQLNLWGNFVWHNLPESKHRVLADCQATQKILLDMAQDNKKWSWPVYEANTQSRINEGRKLKTKTRTLRSKDMDIDWM